MKPVSRSNPDEAAQAALTACQVPELHPLDGVLRMALIAHGSEARKYERLTGLELEFKTDDPVWLVQFAGGVFQPRENATWFGFICGVVLGRAMFYGTGKTIGSGGQVLPPHPVPMEPSLALPTMTR